MLCGVMLACALVTTRWAAVDISPLFVPYFSTAWAVTIVGLLVGIFWWVLQLARERADKPLEIVFSRLKERAPLLLLPVVIFPLFLVSFTACKTAIPFLVGYRWDGFWAASDKLIFQDDVWRIAHGWFGSRSLPIWEWFYTVGWGFAFAFTAVLVAVHMDGRRVAIFYTAMFGTWLIGGFCLAYAMSAAGPVFVYLVDPSLAPRFADLNATLNKTLSVGGSVRETQQYLASVIESHVAVKGGGISAMPSMHLGAASIYVLAARRTLWMLPAILFWAIIFICSGYFGYHYWVDGIVAAVIATLCWWTAESYYLHLRPASAALLEQVA